MSKEEQALFQSQTEYDKSIIRQKFHNSNGNINLIFILYLYFTNIQLNIYLDVKNNILKVTNIKASNSIFSFFTKLIASIFNSLSKNSSIQKMVNIIYL